MVDMLECAVSWLNDMRRAYMSRRVIYQRGDEFIEMAATLGSTTYEITDDAGATVKAVASDFIVSAADLILGGQAVEPQLGDRIMVPVGAATVVYEVLDLGGAGHYRRADPLGKALRIHTKWVDET